MIHKFSKSERGNKAHTDTPSRIKCEAFLVGARTYWGIQKKESERAGEKRKKKIGVPELNARERFVGETGPEP